MSLSSLLPRQDERVFRARNDLAIGIPCLLIDGAEAALCVALESVTEDRFSGLCAALGAPELVISDHRARAVMTAAAAADLGQGPVRITPPADADFSWYQRLVDPKHDDKTVPSSPLHVLRVGETVLHLAGMRLVKSAQLIPAFALFHVDQTDPSLEGLGLGHLEADDISSVLSDEPSLTPVAAAHLPLETSSMSQLHVFREPDGQREHYAVEIGAPRRDVPVLARLHSACFTGDVLGSLKCDCGAQLQTALALMGEEGAGMLLYLNQEGRGIGLANKMRVYDLQSLGFDTVEANQQLGFEDDERDFRLAATMLKALGFAGVRLLTNNPGKVDRLNESGIVVTERLPLRVGQTAQNENYLAVKARKSGHLL